MLFSARLFSLFFSFISIHVTSTFAAGRTSAPSGALVVGSGHYATIQAAVNALQSTSSEQSIFINPGTYQEQVTVPSHSSLITIYGYTANTASWSSNQVTITAAGNLLNAANDDSTGTLRVETSGGFKLYNVNVVNSYGEGSQALALSANAANQGYYGCSFKGYQDTVLAETGVQLFAQSYIEGGADFIFGQSASAWFEQCTIGVLPTSYGTITASGRTSADCVLNKATIGAAPGQSVSAGAYYLGRPWGDYARVAVQNSAMSNVINGAGWHIWNTGDERTDHVSFGEYGNTGAGASGTRASFSTKLSKALTIDQILGSGYAGANYVDTAYL